MNTADPRDAEIAQLTAENAALREQLEHRTEAANGAINAALMMPDPVREQLVKALKYSRRMMKPDSDFAFVDAALTAVGAVDQKGGA